MASSIYIMIIWLWWYDYDNINPVATDGKFPGNSGTESPTTNHCHHNHSFLTFNFFIYLSSNHIQYSTGFTCSSVPPIFSNEDAFISAIESLPPQPFLNTCSEVFFFAMCNPSWQSWSQHWWLPQYQLIPSLACLLAIVLKSLNPFFLMFSSL